MDYLEGLNEAQRDAVTHTEGPLLVLAGAGSGKTRVITFRILHLIRKGVAPHNILAISFTNKAAQEMRERVRQTLTEDNATRHAIIDGLPTTTTFHSFGVRILREYHHIFGLPKHFSIFDRQDTMRALKQAFERAGYDIKSIEPRAVLSMISRAKGEGTSQENFLQNARSHGARAAGTIWRHYDAILFESKALDFDDLLVKTRNLLRDHPTIREEYQNRYTYIHIDEFQDTNVLQMEIVRLLAGHKNVCVVGDVDQSIYSWRGANIENILKFEKYFPDAETILLEENYRSTKTIINASNAIIEKNKNRPEKNVFTNNIEGDQIVCEMGYDARDEASRVARRLQNLIKEGARPSDCTVLYRTNFQSRALEESMLAHDIPYQLLGTKFFERAEVKDVLAYLRFILTREGTTDLTRIINTPTRGIGKVTLLKILEGNRDKLTGRAKNAVDSFYTIIDTLGKIAQEKPLSEILKAIITESGMERTFKDSGDDGEERLGNVRELVTLATKYDHMPSSEATELLLEEAALQSDQDEIKEKETFDAVRLMTVHASKGLEFPYVCITGMEEGLFPHTSMSGNGNDRDTEEERRLFYVALTRAQKQVFLFCAGSRMIFGNTQYYGPSSFLGDIPTHLMHTEAPSENSTKKKGLLDDDWGETTIWL